MPPTDTHLPRTWFFVPGADPRPREAMELSGADALIVGLDDRTPAARRSA